MLGKIAIASHRLAVAAWGRSQRSLPPASDSRRTAVVEAVEKVQQCVVSISSEKKAASHSRWPFSAEENQRPRVSGMGSGVLIDGRGYILTNHHVVDKVQGIVVQLSDGTTYPARVLQFDAVMDLAILKVDADHPLPAIEIGTSSDLMVGETVITIGNAFGYENTVSVGIVSALHRDVTLSDDQVYRNLIQTDACINPGNSGGPLINIDGELIGINVAVRAGAQGIGFALPIDEVKRVAAEMLSTRRLASTWHGLVASEQRQGTKRRVVVISEVQPGSPAEAAGLQAGRRARPGRRPGGRQHPRRRARFARRPPGPSGERDDPPRGPPRPPWRSTSARRRRSGSRGPGRSRRRGLAAAGTQDAAGPDRIRLGGLAQAPRRPLRPGGLAGQPGRPGGHPEGRHPGGHERRHPALGDDPPRQYPLRPAAARDRPDPECTALRRAPQRDPAAPRQPRRVARAFDSEPLN